MNALGAYSIVSRMRMRVKSETSIGEKRACGKIPFNFNYKLNR
jgi:hypothetical protein